MVAFPLLHRNSVAVIVSCPPSLHIPPPSATALPHLTPINSAAMEVIFRDLYGIEQALVGKSLKKNKNGQAGSEYVPAWARRELFDVVSLNARGTSVANVEAAAVKYARNQKYMKAAYSAVASDDKND